MGEEYTGFDRSRHGSSRGMTHPAPGAEELAYAIELEGREATNQPWISFEEFLPLLAAREALVDEPPTMDDALPF